MISLTLFLLNVFVMVSLCLGYDTFKETLLVEKGVDIEGRTIISLNKSQNTFGPTIHVTPGSYFKLTIQNKLCSLKEYEDTQDILYKQYCEVSIHFHGLVPLPNDVDGIPNITQDPIKPEESYTYEFQIPKEACGTYWYHSHSSVQYGDGLRGIFIVECVEMDQIIQEVVGTLENKGISSINEGHLSIPENNERLDLNNIQEEIITLSDYYNDWNFDVFSQRVMSPHGGPDPRITDSLLDGEKSDNVVKELNSNTEYLEVRIINTGMSGTQIFNIENHNFVIVETDGIMIEPYVEETLSIAVGQRYTIIVKLDRNEDYIHIINGCGKMMGYIKKSMWFIRNGKQLEDILIESNAEIKHLPGLNKNERFQELTPHSKTELYYYENYTESITLDYEYSRDIINEYGTRLYLINGLPFQEYVKKPYRFDYKGGENGCLQIVINSLDHMRHPWHLHGYDFQVVSMGEGGEGPLYLEDTESSAYHKFSKDLSYWDNGDEKVPMTRDSINIPGNSFAVIRFIPNRIGKWLFHCHVEWHMGKGLGYIIEVVDSAATAAAATSTSTTMPPKIETTTSKAITTTQHEASTDSTNKVKVITIYLIIMIAINGSIYMAFCV
ncbi:putative multicopper oxidase Gmc1p [Monosporozyma servazzii]